MLLNLRVNYVILDSRLILLKCYAYTVTVYSLIILYFHYLTQNKTSLKSLGLIKHLCAYTWKWREMLRDVNKVNNFKNVSHE